MRKPDGSPKNSSWSAKSTIYTKISVTASKRQKWTTRCWYENIPGLFQKHRRWRETFIFKIIRRHKHVVIFLWYIIILISVYIISTVEKDIFWKYKWEFHPQNAAVIKIAITARKHFAECLLFKMKFIIFFFVGCVLVTAETRVETRVETRAGSSNKVSYEGSILTTDKNYRSGRKKERNDCWTFGAEHTTHNLVLIFSLNSVGSVTEIWNPLLKKFSKYFNKHGQKHIRKFSKYLDPLNLCITKRDKKCIAKIFDKYIEITRSIIPCHKNEEFMYAAKVEPIELSYMVKFRQAMMSESNDTIVECMDAYLKPLANTLYETMISCENGHCTRVSV